MFNHPLPPVPPGPITHAQLLADYFALEFSVVSLTIRYKLTPTQFAEFWEHPQTVRALAAFEASQAFLRRHHAHEHQMLAAEALVDTSMNRRGHPESRRAATVLARLTIHIQRHNTARRTKNETTTPAAASPPLPVPREEAAPGEASLPSPSSPAAYHHSAAFGASSAADTITSKPPYAHTEPKTYLADSA